MTPSDFVVQAPGLSPSILADLAGLSRAGAFIPFGAGMPPAFRFPGTGPDSTLLSTAIAMGCDAAYVPRVLALASVILLATRSTTRTFLATT